MKKEKYITPSVKAVEVKADDIIRTSVFELNSSDELGKVGESYFEGTGIEGLFK